MLNEVRESNIRKIYNIVKKADNVTDKVEISKSDVFKLFSIAGLVDQKFNKSLDCMTEEEKHEAEDAIIKAPLPADIIISDTVPIKHVEIIVNERNDVVKHRVLIFDKKDWIPLGTTKEEEKTPDGDFDHTYDDNEINIETATIIGAVTLFLYEYNTEPKISRTVTMPILYVKKEDKPILGIEATNSYLKNFNRFIPFGGEAPVNEAIYESGEWALGTLNIWYAIQVSLLNPLIDYRTVNNQTVVPQTKTRNGKKKTPAKVKYYKTIYIEEETIDQFFEEQKNEKGEINRHCLMWYVTGHWRKYKNGKRIFIHGYWKGEGRFSGVEAETRQRELVLNEEDLPKERIQKPIEPEPVRRLFVDPSYNEKVRCECGKYVGTDHLAERCDACNTFVMYRG